jgi:hypothetical protein
MKTASLTGSLLMMKGRAVPSLSNKQTQDYVGEKSSMFASLTIGTGEDEETEIFMPPEVDDDYLHIPDVVLMSDDEIEAPIDSIVSEPEHDILPEVPEKKEIMESAPETLGYRVSTSLRLSEDRHLQLRLLAARKKDTIQSVLQVMVHDHLDADMKGLPCICGAHMED